MRRNDTSKLTPEFQNPAALSTVTVSSGTSSTTLPAQVGLNHATVDSKDEYSIFLAPALLDELKNIVDEPNNLTFLNPLKRQAVSASDLQKLLEEKMAVIMAPAMAVGLGGIALNKLGFSALIGLAFNIGSKAIPAVAILGTVISNYIQIFQSIHDPNYRKAVKVPLDQLKATGRCPSTPVQCSSCGGQNLLCMTGANTNCPCDDGCPNNPLPDCDSCNGDTMTNACTTGSAKGCPCQRLPVAIADTVDVAFWNFANALVQKIYKPPNSQGNLTCSVPDPPKFLTQFPTMRQIICSQSCNQGPAGIPSGSVQVISDANNQACAIVAALAAGFQAIVYRATPFTGTQQQQCWDSTAFSINCTTNPNHLGWVNGPDDYQFYQAGFQSLNAKPPGDLSLHTKFSASQAHATPTPHMPSATSGNHDGSSNCAAYQWHAPSVISQYVDSYLYTNYTSYFHADGFYNGITAIVQCKDDASYAIGMLSSQIKTAIGWIKSIYKGKGCG
ncbi:hypothetical protein V8E54_011501 [Elaphomyces granulatus]